jgi:Asp-tRNA(Asn)/Glu-tRNA(Gln) amidotransferase A subunit family amidase
LPDPPALKRRSPCGKDGRAWILRCDGLGRAGATGIQKHLKAIEIVDAAIESIERLNPTLNAVVTPVYEQARKLGNGKMPDGPFTGVSFLLKDLGAPYARVPMTTGSATMREFVPDHVSQLVARLKRAGLIILGKTNTPEFGILPTTEPKIFGSCHNPLDVDRTTGSSSGGSAAAVAARLVPMAHANDGGGSIRIPASRCGLFGLKPTRGRNPLGPDFGDPVTIKKGEVPVFWACGVTPQAVLMKAKPDLCITHTPGHMFISDLLNEELATL